MRKLSVPLFAVWLFTLAGCGCFEPVTDNPFILGRGQPDPDQPAWHRCLFGTQYISNPPPGSGWGNEGPPQAR
jgi:hypothetical protein